MKASEKIAAVLSELGPRFAERAAAADSKDRFVAENYAELKAHGLIAAGVPEELGGLGASHAELCDMLRRIAYQCGSTGLAFSMHTHQVATNAWRWRYQKAPVDGLLKRVAAENIVLLSSGGSDWLQGSGTATRVEGGYRINGRKIFSSGAPAGDLLMTSAVYDDPEAGPSVLHFAVPMKASGVKLLDTWRVMGMRGTGSHDIELTDVFMADAAIGGKRPQGKWHPLFHIADHASVELIGAIDNELTMARLALLDMITAAATNDPGLATTNRVMIGRTLVARAVLKTVELAMEAAGGNAFYRSAGLERLFRDAQGARYHPLREGAQKCYAGQMALGLDVDEAI